ncbi:MULTISPECIES: GNAT family N-acetyltransferase [Pseudoalteromonas]|uniref:GNAT family N-acetyltransferase n=1 Tax=Pseudoalteromonas TaxID=53246 RepID=UPI00030ED0FB|nr:MULTISPECIES: GNAT family N-acetyltransferase [Pseudoalteromonas]MCF6145386.1 hypothetical protein [Pseudoalteromonas mariniglutinosa NCIMB 1770]
MNVPRTARLHFKLMDENDSALLLELDSDPQVMAHLTRGKVSTIDTIKEIFMPRMQAYRNPSLGWGLWQVNLTESNSFIGWVLIRPMGFFTDQPDHSDIEIGWRFKRASWGKGYASEAAAAVADAVIKHNAIHTLSATALEANRASIKVMEKLGMQFVEHYSHRDEFGELPAVLYRKFV